MVYVGALAGCRGVESYPPGGFFSDDIAMSDYRLEAKVEGHARQRARYQKKEEHISRPLLPCLTKARDYVSIFLNGSWRWCPKPANLLSNAISFSGLVA